MADDKEKKEEKKDGMNPIVPLVAGGIGIFLFSIPIFLFAKGMISIEAPRLRPSEELVMADTVLTALYLAAEEQKAADQAGESSAIAPPATKSESTDGQPDPTGETVPAVTEPAETGEKESDPVETVVTGSPEDEQPGEAPAVSESEIPVPDVVPAATPPESLLPYDPAKLSRLVKVYDKMRPKQVATILSTMPDRQAAQILGSMKDKTAAQTLAAITPKRAARLSELIVRMYQD